MKIAIASLTALTVAGVASAQSSVTLFGVVDASVSGFSNKSDLAVPSLTTPLLPGSIKAQRKELRNSSNSSSRLGFRGTEDLGGGLAASFWLEAPITNDDGQQAIATFQRRSTVSLSGDLGEIRLGRDYTPTFWNDSVFDPFGVVGVGGSLILTASSAFNIWLGGATASVPGIANVTGNSYSRASNSVGYFLPRRLGGFYGQVMYGLSERDKYDPGALTPAAMNTQRTGRYVGGRMGYANGPLDAAIAIGNGTIGDSFFAGTTTSIKTINFGASYDFGVAKLFGEYSKLKNEIDFKVLAPIPRPDIDLSGYLVGVTVPIGPGLIRASYAHVKYDFNLPSAGPALVGNYGDPEINKLALGYVYNLSKRTALYATVARLRNKNGAALTLGGPAFVTSFQGQAFAAKTSTGYDFGIRHGF